jgi:uncharacterized iron-regulated membrane protein
MQATTPQNNLKKNKTTKQKIRASFFWVHKWLGLISGIIMLVVALTGCIYVFEEEIRQTFEAKFYTVQSTNQNKIDVNQLQAIALKNIAATDKIKNIHIKENSTAAVLVTTQKNKLLSINPYTGAIVGVKNTQNDFLDTVLKLHRTLLLGEVGKQVIKYNVVLFFILCISGLILWWPKQKQFFKKAATINFKTKNKKLLIWELHSVLGFYSVFVLLLIAFTGMVFAFDGVKDALRTVTGATKDKKIKLTPQPTVATFNLQNTYQAYSLQYPNAQETIIAYPKDSTETLRLIFEYPFALVRKQNQFFINPYTGATEKQLLYKNYNSYDKIVKSNYQLHTGSIPALGLGSKIIFFLVSLFCASLPITGFLIWLGRGKKMNN